jgi:transposase
MASNRDEDLFPETRNPEGTRFINERCQIRTQDDRRLVLVSGIPMAQYSVDDCMSEAYAMVSLIDQGWANQKDVARAFGYSVRTARRYQRRFDEGGLAALGRPEGYPRGRARLKTSRRRWIQQLKTQGHSHAEIAQRLGISVRAVRKTLRCLGWKPTCATQAELPIDAPGSVNPRTSAEASLIQATAASTTSSGEDPNLSVQRAQSRRVAGRAGSGPER